MTGINNVKRCATCHFALMVAGDFTKRLCYGAPPSSIQLPAPGGKTTVQSSRPFVMITDLACALYREKDGVDQVRDDNTMKGIGPDTPATKQ